MAQRDPSLYGLQTLSPVIVPSRLQITEQGVTQLVFEGFTDEAAFVAGDVSSLKQLRVALTPTADDVAPHQSTIDAIKAKALDIMGLGGRSCILTNFVISTTGKVLEMSARSASGNFLPSVIYEADEYDALLAANMDLAVEALSVMWSIGKAKDEFLKTLTAV